MLLFTMKLGGNVSKGIMFFQGWIKMGVSLLFFLFLFLFSKLLVLYTVICHVTI